MLSLVYHGRAPCDISQGFKRGGERGQGFTGLMWGAFYISESTSSLPSKSCFEIFIALCFAAKIIISQVSSVLIVALLQIEHNTFLHTRHCLRATWCQPPPLPHHSKVLPFLNAENGIDELIEMRYVIPHVLISHVIAGPLQVISFIYLDKQSVVNIQRIVNSQVCLKILLNLLVRKLSCHSSFSFAVCMHWIPHLHSELEL